MCSVSLTITTCPMVSLVISVLELPAPFPNTVEQCVPRPAFAAPQATPNPLQFGVPAERTDERFPFQALSARSLAVAVQPDTRPQVGQGADDNLLHLFALVVRHLPEPRVKHGLRYFQFYNTRRPHTSLERQTPDQVYFNRPHTPVAA